MIRSNWSRIMLKTWREEAESFEHLDAQSATKIIKTRMSDLSLQISKKKWLSHISLCLLQTKLKMSEAVLSIMNSIEIKLSCCITLMLSVSWLIIVSVIDDCSIDDIKKCRARLEETSEWSLKFIVYLNRSSLHLLSNNQSFWFLWILSDEWHWILTIIIFSKKNTRLQRLTHSRNEYSNFVC